jgi:hypothetical protein
VCASPWHVGCVLPTTSPATLTLTSHAGSLVWRQQPQRVHDGLTVGARVHLDDTPGPLSWRDDGGSCRRRAATAVARRPGGRSGRARGWAGQRAPKRARLRLRHVQQAPHLAARPSGVCGTHDGVGCSSTMREAERPARGERQKTQSPDKRGHMRSDMTLCRFQAP